MVWYVYRRETPTFHSNIGTGLPDTERHTTGDFILTTGHHILPENGKLETVKYLNYWIPWQQMTQDTHMKLNAKSPWKKGGSFHQQNQIQILRKATSDSETWTLQKQDNKYLESSEMLCWRRMEKISWTNHVRNAEVLQWVRDERNIIHTVNRRKFNWIGHILHNKCLLKHVIEGKGEGRIWGEDEEEDVSSYWIMLIKSDDTVNWKRKQ